MDAEREVQVNDQMNRLDKNVAELLNRIEDLTPRLGSVLHDASSDILEEKDTPVEPLCQLADHIRTVRYQVETALDSLADIYRRLEV